MTIAIDQATFNVAEFASVLRLHSIEQPTAELAVLDVSEILQLGIVAYEWLLLSDQSNRAKLAFDSDDKAWATQDKRIHETCAGWLQTASEVKAAADTLVRQGRVLPTFPRFLECFTEMTAIVRFADQDDTKATMPAWLEQHRDTAIREIIHGQTLPLVQSE